MESGESIGIGLAAEKSGSINLVRNQFVCADFQIAKVFISAIAGGEWYPRLRVHNMAYPLSIP